MLLAAVAVIWIRSYWVVESVECAGSDQEVTTLRRIGVFSSFGSVNCFSVRHRLDKSIEGRKLAERPPLRSGPYAMLWIRWPISAEVRANRAGSLWNRLGFFW